MRFYFSLLLLLCLNLAAVVAQTAKQNSGWLFLMNTTRFNDKWGMHFDVQFRTQDNWDGLRHILIRPGLTYYLNGKSDLTLGYLYTPTFVKTAGQPDVTLTEHRIWEQYIYKHKLRGVNLSHRLRLEQRFVERNGADDVFAQRFRYFIRALVPLIREGELFEKGVFVALQNELFLNVHHKDDLNGHVFDQNRAYGAIGYRLSKAFDIEAGYMNQAVKGALNNTSNNIVQLAVYTRF
ncbi:DUF2490 domain-containing protein [Pedobacter sp. JY14-1]|uniref:DUF2490 domain-containing protein n=1 Tax=Pedobacter sp. JY14-1 TaxID=3034151 RepID=UPI0023E16F3E|nr:DUF2490 domain-containing protein [Pedobacter sp. JY14-1]